LRTWPFTHKAEKTAGWNVFRSFNYFFEALKRAAPFLPGYPIAFLPCNAKTSYVLPGAQACSFFGFLPKLIC
jgi:hypothetical protein